MLHPTLINEAMKSYYYADSNNIQQGPFELEELKEKPITRNTLVWHSGLDQWTLACQVKELGDTFANTPPNLNIPATPMNPVMPPRTWMLESILVMFCCFFPLGLVGLIYASGVESKWRRGLYAEALHDSDEAARWTKLGLWIGLAIWIIFPILMFLIPAVGLGFPFFARLPMWHV